MKTNEQTTIGLSLVRRSPPFTRDRRRRRAAAGDASQIGRPRATRPRPRARRSPPRRRSSGARWRRRRPSAHAPPPSCRRRCRTAECRIGAHRRLELRVDGVFDFVFVVRDVASRTLTFDGAKRTLALGALVDDARRTPLAGVADEAVAWRARGRTRRAAARAAARIGRRHAVGAARAAQQAVGRSDRHDSARQRVRARARARCFIRRVRRVGVAQQQTVDSLAVKRSVDDRHGARRPTRLVAEHVVAEQRANDGTVHDADCDKQKLRENE